MGPLTCLSRKNTDVTYNIKLWLHSIWVSQFLLLCTWLNRAMLLSPPVLSCYDKSLYLLHQTFITFNITFECHKKIKDVFRVTYLRVSPSYELNHPWPFSTVRAPTHICLPCLKEVWGWPFWHLWTSMTGDSGKAFTAWKNHLLSTNRVRVALPQTMLVIWE